MVENPHMSTSQITTAIETINSTSVRRVLKSSKHHPYHVQLHQQLNKDDFNGT